jgi:hypothetical protein
MGDIVNVDFINGEIVEKSSSTNLILNKRNPLLKGVAVVLSTITALSVYAQFKGNKPETEKSITTSISTVEKYNPHYKFDSISVVLVSGDQKYNDIVDEMNMILNEYGISSQATYSYEKAFKEAKEQDENSKEILVIGIGGYENNADRPIVLGSLNDAVKNENHNYNSSSLALCLATNANAPVYSGYYSARTGQRAETIIESTFKNKEFNNTVKTASIAIPNHQEYLGGYVNTVVGGIIKYSGLTLLERQDNYFSLAGNSNIKSRSKQFGTNNIAGDYYDTVYIGSDKLLNNLQQPIDFDKLEKPKTIN